MNPTPSSSGFSSHLPYNAAGLIVCLALLGSCLTAFHSAAAAAVQKERILLNIAAMSDASKVSTTDADPFFPFIDTFGQYRHKDWPGKILGQAQLVQRRNEEAKALMASPGPKQWSRFGGWLNGPKLNATGLFRTAKHDGKWWLVDPDGYLFFSHGVDCVRMIEFTPVSERGAWFENFPGHHPEFAEFVLKRGYALKFHYAGRSPQCFAFGGANLLRKYGPDWRQEYQRLVHQRLCSWGLNTIGLWSDHSLRLARKTPYVDGVSSRRAKMIEGSAGYWGKFPDVFDSSFPQSLRRSMAGKKNSSARDPWCLGYFSDNELAWGDELSLAVAALQSPPDQPVKMVFRDTLKKKYGHIDALNEAWDTSYASWNALLKSNKPPDRQKAKPDLAAFYTRIAETYFRTVRDIIREHSSNHLYLGCRFAWVNDRAARAAARYCDVVSFNLYRRSVADFKFNGHADVPLIIGEFHFGALDRGMMHTGLVSTSDQTARAAAYRHYVEGVLRHPSFVGCHWFQYKDQPTVGRVLDGENYQIGLVDIADTPYPETIQAVRIVGENLYRLRGAAK